MTKIHERQRRKWVKKTVNVDWNRVVFSDEKIFLLNNLPNKKNDVQWTDSPRSVFPLQVDKSFQRTSCMGSDM
jgi:hypothetical protein